MHEVIWTDYKTFIVANYPINREHRDLKSACPYTLVKLIINDKTQSYKYHYGRLCLNSVRI